MIIGLTGKMAAGKGTVAEYLKSKGYVYHSLSDILRDELKVRQIEENIPNLVKVGNELRASGGPGILAQMTLKKISDAGELKSIVDSIRNPKEIEELKRSNKFILIGVDAPQELRFKRMSGRGRVGDGMTHEEFKEQDAKQAESADPNAQQLLACFKEADRVVVNDGALEELYQKIDNILIKINTD